MAGRSRDGITQRQRPCRAVVCGATPYTAGDPVLHRRHIRKRGHIAPNRGRLPPPPPPLRRAPPPPPRRSYTEPRGNGNGGGGGAGGGGGERESGRPPHPRPLSPASTSKGSNQA